MKKAMSILSILVFTFSLIAKETNIKTNSNSVAIDKKELKRLFEISSEYNTLFLKSKPKLKIEQLDSNKIKATLIVAENLKYSDDMIYSTIITFDKEIKQIKETDNDFIISFNEETKTDLNYATKVKWFLYGAGVTIIVIASVWFIQSLKS